MNGCAESSIMLRSFITFFSCLCATISFLCSALSAYTSPDAPASCALDATTTGGARDSIQHKERKMSQREVGAASKRDDMTIDSEKGLGQARGGGGGGAPDRAGGGHHDDDDERRRATTISTTMTMTRGAGGTRDDATTTTATRKERSKKRDAREARAWTSETRPKVPAPRIARRLRSENLRSMRGGSGTPLGESLTPSGRLPSVTRLSSARRASAARSMISASPPSVAVKSARRIVKQTTFRRGEGGRGRARICVCVCARV